MYACVPVCVCMSVREGGIERERGTKRDRESVCVCVCACVCVPRRSCRCARPGPGRPRQQHRGRSCRARRPRPPTTNPHVNTKSTDFRILGILACKKVNRQSEIGRFGLGVRVGGGLALCGRDSGTLPQRGAPCHARRPAGGCALPPAIRSELFTPFQGGRFPLNTKLPEFSIQGQSPFSRTSK